MLRLPRLRYLRPADAAEAAAMMAEAGGRAMLVAGGTDLFPKLKRRQFTPEALVQVPSLCGISGDAAAGFTLGAGVTLAEIARSSPLGEAAAGFAEAAGQVSSPALREAGTLGGNLCVDTRCNYYDQTYEWRRAAGFCLKRDGDICLVAPASPRCWAVSSTDVAPAAVVLEAEVSLVGPDGERRIPVEALYRDDGIEYLGKRPEEVLTAVHLPPAQGRASAYVKLRRRGSIDFPLGGAAIALRLEAGAVSSCRVALTAVASHPLRCRQAEEFLNGRELDEETLLEGARLAARPSRPLDNTDLTHAWRKRMVSRTVAEALRVARDRAGGAGRQG
ncbi:MAG: FAD binding domain-containing protein [Candidatus Dormibacterales bacterium]